MRSEEIGGNLGKDLGLKLLFTSYIYIKYIKVCGFHNGIKSLQNFTFN